MAKAGSKYAVPANPLRATETIWKKGKLIHRVHSSTYTETEFNPSPKSNARFSPIRDVAGNIIPVLYGGSTMDCALMETVFRDVPYSPGPKNVESGQFERSVKEARRSIEIDPDFAVWLYQSGAQVLFT